ncbi:MAG: DUF4249 domain-containing protein [Lewinellaceae bacterium]|nr:DUF4249 domain-containing protein [Saprospiraceae bacterium]MCB9340699.1 DUF4249 domain-containing protein [Lewinellaceae bacterium]
MLRNYSNLFLALLLVSFFSCEEPLEIEINQESRLVVISHFTQDKDLQVFVSKTKSIQDTREAGAVTDATVMVFAGNELKEILELVPGDNATLEQPHYKTKELNPLSGEVYTIKVSAPGFKSVTATNSIPTSVPIESVKFSPVFKGTGTKDLTINFEISVTYSDPVEVNNFYHLVFYQELYPYSINSNGDTITSPNPVFVRPNRIDVDFPGQPLTKHFDNGSFLIKDVSFNGKEVTFYLNGVYTFDPSEFSPGSFLVELRTVSEAYYLYHLSLTNQTNAKRDPLSEGVFVDDNIENGDGIFAGYSSSINSSNLVN